MCKVMEDMRNESLKEGEKRGMEKGLQRGMRSCTNRLKAF